MLNSKGLFLSNGKLGTHWVPIHAMCHQESRSTILCLVPEVSYETDFSLSFPLVCSLCKSLESLNKPDCCIPLLEKPSVPFFCLQDKVQVVSVYEILYSWLHPTFPDSYISFSRTCCFLFCPCFWWSSLLSWVPLPVLLGLVSFLLILQRPLKCLQTFLGLSSALFH